MLSKESTTVMAVHSVTTLLHTLYDHVVERSTTHGWDGLWRSADALYSVYSSCVLLYSNGMMVSSSTP